MQQIIVSGVGGQGVLFVTKLLAETALDIGCSVFVSETHGMAQRGGNVISHLKVGRAAGSPDADFVSPLIRPGKADILLALHTDAMLAHGFYLKPGGDVFRSTPTPQDSRSINGAKIAQQLGSPVSANLVLLGFAAASGSLFCNAGQVEETLKRLGGKRLDASLKAFQAGRDAG